MVNKLLTGWKTWDKELSHFQHKKINILELGAFEGEATEWFLVNLCTHPDSKVYALDTWEGSVEYIHTDFKKIEKTFNEKIKSIHKNNQLIKMKTNTDKGLLHLYHNNIEFDIIFIDASHLAKDVLSDAILSWKILKNGGVLIFDDYRWNKLEKNIDKPKIAIDSFLKIYSNEIKILAMKYQVLVQKEKKKLINENHKLNNYYSLTQQINQYKLFNLNYLISNLDFDFTYDLKLSKKIPEFEKKLGYNSLVKDTLDYYLKYKKTIVNASLDNYQLNRFLRPVSNFSKLFSSLSNSLFSKLNSYCKNKNVNLQNKIYSIYYFLDKCKGITLLEKISVIKNNNLYEHKKNTNLYFCNFSFWIGLENKYFIKILNLMFPSIKNVIIYDINLGWKEYELTKYKINNTAHELIHLEVRNYYDLLMLNSQIKNKLDIIFILIKGELWKYNKNINFEQVNIISKFYSILFILTNQNKGGCCCIIFESLLTNQSIELLIILKKYYKKILLNPTNYENDIRNKVHVICSDFQGINMKDLKELYKMGESIQQKNMFHNKINNNYYYVQKFINIKPKFKLKYDTLINKISNFNKLYLEKFI